MLTLREKALSKKYLIAAHRGSSGTAPENTLAAYQEAIDSGADIIEADIQITADGYAVAFHDKNLSRTTDGKGIAKENTLDNLRMLDAGSWFSDKFRGEHIPLLSDVINLIKGKCYLNIEVKNIDGENADDRLRTIIEIIKKEKYEDYTLFSSFYYNTLMKIKEEAPAFPTAAIRIPRDVRLPSDILRNVRCDAFICSLDEMTEDVVKDIRVNRIYSAVYLIDSEEHLDAALQLPTKAFVTNYPGRITQLLEVRAIR